MCVDLTDLWTERWKLIKNDTHNTQAFSNFAMCQLSAWKLFIFCIRPLSVFAYRWGLLCVRTRHKWYIVADTFAVIWIPPTIQMFYNSLAVR